MSTLLVRQPKRAAGTGVRPPSRRRRRSKRRVALGVLMGIVLVAVAAVAAGRLVLERQIAGEVDQLLAATASAPPGVVAEADLAALPEPVQRWLRWSQSVGRERAATARLLQEGDFRLAEGGDWIPFAAEQSFTTDPPGFVWKTSMQMAPLLDVRGRDRYVEGRADIRMRVLSLIPVADSSGPGLDQGALGRYLGEIVWFPSAALSRHVSWEHVDESSARATIAYGGASASGTFSFDAEGRPTGFRGTRYNDARGRQESFSVPIHAWGEVDGIRIPTEGDGIWHFASGDHEFIRWRITGGGYGPGSTG